MAYASRTNMASTVAAIGARGWRWLIEPSHANFPHGRTPPEYPYMIDNGAWGCFNRGVEWDGDAFMHYLDEHGAGADMIVLPDIVGGGEESLGRSLSWVGRVRPFGSRMLLAVQDGMEPAHIEPLLAPLGLGLFVGGSTEWKLSTLMAWGGVAERVGCWLHVARVNSARRIRLCALAGADSFDGTSVTKWPSTIHRLDEARRGATAQASLFAPSEMGDR